MIVNHVWSEENLNINAHGLSSSFNVNRDKNKSKYMSVNLIHGENVVTREKLPFFVFFWRTEAALSIFTFFFSQGFKQQCLVS